MCFTLYYLFHYGKSKVPNFNVVFMEFSLFILLVPFVRDGNILTILVVVDLQANW